MAERVYLQGPKKGWAPNYFPRSLVFDANVWLSINGPFEDSNQARARAYSHFYKKAVEGGCTICLPQLVATEFLNRAIGIQAKQAGFDKSKGKIHQAVGYGDWIKEACDLLNAIVDGNKRLSDGFDGLDLEACYKCAEAGGLEFHDVLLVDLCAREHHTLVTDDADFTGQNVPIVTWNERLA